MLSTSWFAMPAMAGHTYNRPDIPPRASRLNYQIEKMFAVVGRSVIFADSLEAAIARVDTGHCLSSIPSNALCSIDAMLHELSQPGSLYSQRVPVICGFGVDFSSSPIVSVFQFPASKHHSVLMAGIQPRSPRSGSHAKVEFIVLWFSPFLVQPCGSAHQSFQLYNSCYVLSSIDPTNCMPVIPTQLLSAFSITRPFNRCAVDYLY